MYIHNYPAAIPPRQLPPALHRLNSTAPSDHEHTHTPVSYRRLSDWLPVGLAVCSPLKSHIFEGWGFGRVTLSTLASSSGPADDVRVWTNVIAS